MLLFAIIITLFFCCKNEKIEDEIIAENKVNEIPESIKKLMNAAIKDSNNVTLKLQIISSLDSLGLHNEALNNLDKLITTDSLNNIFWLKRGQICKQTGDTIAAIKAFKYSARVYPTPQAMMELANLYAY